MKIICCEITVRYVSIKEGKVLVITVVCHLPSSGSYIYVQKNNNTKTQTNYAKSWTKLN